MKRFLAGSLLALLVLPGGGLVTTRGQAEGSEADDRTVVALDLMDLELPGESEGVQMELPPIEEPRAPVEEERPPTAEPRPAPVEESWIESPAPGGSVRSPTPGIAPFLLEESTGRPAKARPAATSAEGPDEEIPPEEIPAELKTVPPPPSRAESLKLPSGAEGSASGASEVPDIPLLKVEDTAGQETSVSGGQDSSLSLKPLSDVYGTAEVGRGEAPPQAVRQQQDYLQVREDIDSRLFDIYDRFYKDR